MQHLEVSCAVRQIYKSLGFKGISYIMWPVRLYHILPHFFINDTIFKKKMLLNIKRVF